MFYKNLIFETQHLRVTWIKYYLILFERLQIFGLHQFIYYNLRTELLNV